MAKKFNIEKFNLLLADAGQKVFAEKISTTEISLSNGVILTSNNEIIAAKQWCAKNGYDFLIVDDIYLRALPFPESLDNFDIATQTKIRKLYETC